jgi:hypothetical protein
LISLIAGPEEAKNRAGKESLRLIQTRLATPSPQKISPACQSRKPSLESPTQVRRQLSAAHTFFAQAKFQPASCASASVTTRDDSYTRVPHYQVLSYLSFPPADKKR